MSQNNFNAPLNDSNTLNESHCLCFVAGEKTDHPGPQGHNSELQSEVTAVHVAAEKTRLQDGNDVCSRHLVKLHSVNVKQKSEITQLKAAVDHLNSLKHKYLTENLQLRAALQSSQEKKDNLKKQIQNLQTDITILGNKCKKKEAECDRLMRGMTELEGDAEVTRIQLHKLKSEMEVKLALNAYLKNDVDNLQGENESLRAEAYKLKLSVSTFQQTKEFLMEQNERMAKEVSLKENTNKNLEKVLTDLKHQLKEAKQVISDKNEKIQNQVCEITDKQCIID